jgi:hypothetical protein
MSLLLKDALTHDHNVRLGEWRKGKDKGPRTF